MIRNRLIPLALLAAAGLVAAVRAEAPVGPPSALRLVPTGAELVFQVPNPTAAIQAVTRVEAAHKLLALPAIKEALGSTSTRRLLQFLAHFEKSLGAPWPDLVERLAGHGVVVAARLGDNAPVVLAIQGKDEKLLEKFLATAIEVAEAELARQESKQRVEKGDYHGIPGFKIGDLYVARLGASLVLANKKEAFRKVLDLHREGGKPSLADVPALKEAARLLPEKPLVTAWLNMEPIQKRPEAQAFYKSPRDDTLQTILFGGYLDLLGRTPFLCAALAPAENGFLATIRAPRGLEGAGGDRYLHMPPLEQPATYPPLQPKNTLYSLSFHLDLASFWQHRDQLLPASAAKGLATFEKNSGRILGGVKISTLLESAGANHRFIVANQVKRPYQREPYVKLPAFAFVSQLREPERFGRAMETLLRTVGLFTTDTFKLELHEEQHAGRDIVAYRFKEKGEVRDDVNLLRYNFVPCFARAGNQFILCSNLELCRELLDLVQAEERKTPSPVPVKAWEYFSSKGLAGYLRDIDDQLITQTILDQATPPAEARKQVDDLIDFIAGLGSVRGSVRFQPKTFRYDLYLRLAK